MDCFKNNAGKSGPAVILLAALAGVFCLMPAWADAPEVSACQALPGITPFCGLQAPEDFQLSPDRQALIMGEFGGLAAPVPGRLLRFDLRTGKSTTLYPRTGGDGNPDWGHNACPGAPAKDLSPHGIHLSQRSDGQWQLLVVNHRQRESIEFFQLHAAGQLSWRGCVVMPKGTFLNDVVALPEGGFIATHMFDKGDPKAVEGAMKGAAMGHLISWRPGGQVKPVANSKMPFPNGIQISPDGANLYVNVYGSGEVRKIERATGKLLATVKVPGPDNSNWSDDGRLLVASHTGEVNYEKGECTSVGAGYCPMAFEIVSLNPDTLSRQTLFSHEGAPMGAGTTAIKVGRDLYIGSFSGDRLIKVRLKE